MKHTHPAIETQQRFVTIWIFARMKQIENKKTIPLRFVTVWIFARMKQVGYLEYRLHRFVTIWILLEYFQSFIFINVHNSLTSNHCKFL